jgi:hypothetical protein
MISEELNNSWANTIDSWTKLITLYEAWNKLEKADEWRTKLSQIEAKTE